MVYVLHFTKQVGGRASHYIGYTDNMERRIAQHRKGKKAGGSPLVCEAFRIGEVVLGGLYEGDRSLERRMKQRKNSKYFCEICNSAKYNNLEQEF